MHQTKTNIVLFIYSLHLLYFIQGYRIYILLESRIMTNVPSTVRDILARDILTETAKEDIEEDSRLSLSRLSPTMLLMLIG